MRVALWMKGCRTGGSALPRGIGCGATGAEGAVSAQNQPIVNYRTEEEEVFGFERRVNCMKGIRLKKMLRVAEIVGTNFWCRVPVVIALSITCRTPIGRIRSEQVKDICLAIEVAMRLNVRS